MGTSFETIGIIGRLKNKGVTETLIALVEYLENIDQKLIIEAETAESLQKNKFSIVSREELGKACDLVIVVGGDGSLLNAIHAVIEDETPVLGVNRGSLGFLTDIHPAELDKIAEILKGGYSCENRFLLSGQVTYEGKTLGRGDALNEIAIIPAMTPHMIQFEIYIDNQFVCSQNSDGLIIATPTGSTAYALSGGGPIVHPQLDAIVLVPMFPHTLTARPIVVEGNKEITIRIANNNRSSSRLSCDAQQYIEAPPGSQITINKKKKLLHLIHPLDYNYYKTLRSKLHWGKKLHYHK